MTHRRALVVSLLLAGVPALAEVVSYEATSSFPEEGNGWDRSTFCAPERTIDDGLMRQVVEPGECAAPPSGDRDSYTRAIGAFTGSRAFFMEWVVFSEGDNSEFTWGAPAVITAWSFGVPFYGFTIARDEVKFVQDAFVVILFVPIAPDVFHKHRLEVYWDAEYRWYIDDQLVHTGTPGAGYPDFNPAINWRAKSAFMESTVAWDYIRYGDIPAASSGDFDSEGDVDLRDWFYFEECAANGGPDIDAGPGCLWADMDADGDVDFADFRRFQLGFTGDGG